MHRLKEENKRIREIQTANARKLATYEKTSRQQQNQIQRLMRDAMLKDENLKRKMEEVQRLKNEQKASLKYLLWSGVNYYFSYRKL
jgi:hypothetical protein